MQWKFWLEGVLIPAVGLPGFLGKDHDAGDEGGQDGKKQEIINNNYYEKYRNDSEVTTLENSDSTDSCDATKVWL